MDGTTHKGGRVMFDSFANRCRYEDARERHVDLITGKSWEAKSYQAGFRGEPDWRGYSFEYWCAGRDNASGKA